MQLPRAIIGVDPGDKGAICLMLLDTKAIAFSKTTLNTVDLIAIYKTWMELYDITMVVVEDVHAIPQSSAKSSFNFGANTERMVVIPMTLGIPVLRIQPKKWQKEMQISVPQALKGTPRKNAIKKKVAEVVHAQFPHAELYGIRGGLLDGRSDALAIAEASRRLFKQS